MNRSLLPFSLVSVLALLLVSGIVPTWEGVASGAKAKVAVGGPGACGYRSIPLATGNTWTYMAGTQQIVLKITGVGPGKDWNGRAATVVDVDETFNGRTVKIQWSCTPTGGLVVPIESFLWSGEPGGPVGGTFTIKSHERPWLVSETELVGDVAWIEIVSADVVRPDGGGAGAQHRPATLSVERHAQLKGTENVATPLGQFATEKVVFELRGKATLEDQTAVVPIKRPATVWFTKGLGVVKFDDAFDKTWELTESNLLQPPQPK
jgi:hypothetical protein